MSLSFEYVCDATTNVGKVQLTAPNGHVTECLMMGLEPYIYDTICEYLPEDTKAAEVGSFKGGSACILGHGMARRSKRLQLWAHDLFEPFEVGGKTEDIAGAFDASVRAWDVPVIKVKGDSKMTHTVHDDASLDYVFIDGDHTYDGALADIRHFAKKVAPGGWLLIQDSIGEVQRAVQDGFPLGFVSTCICPPHGHYVTVCHRDPVLLCTFLTRLGEAYVAAAPAPAARPSSLGPRPKP
jgi:hypothetical protein